MDIRNAIEKLRNNHLYVCNMVYDNTQYEVSDVNGKVLIDNLSEAQLVNLSELALWLVNDVLNNTDDLTTPDNDTLNQYFM